MAERIDLDQIIEDYQENYESMLNRMDDNYERLYKLQPFILDKDSKETSITFAGPRRYADKVMQTCEAAKMVVKVRTPDVQGSKKKFSIFPMKKIMDSEQDEQSKNHEKERNIEHLAYGLVRSGDINLRKRRITRGRTIQAADIFYATIMGAICHRNLLVKEDGKLIADILPINPRFFFFGVGKNGMSYAGHYSYRDADTIVSEYGTKFDDAEDDTRIVDYWDDEVNIIQIGCGDKANIIKQKHGLKKPPFTFCPVGSSPIVFSNKEESCYTHLDDWCQDVFGSARNLYDVKNRIGSIWMTLLQKSHKPSYFLFAGGKMKIEDLPWGQNKMMYLPESARAEMIKPPDIAMSAPQLFGIVDRELQTSDLSTLEYGMVEGADYPSSKALTALGHGKDSKVGPILRALSSSFEDSFEMLCEQYEKQGIKTTFVGYDSKDQSFYKEIKPTDIKKPWTIDVSFVSITPEEDIQNIAKAQMLGKIPGVSTKYILDEGLRVSNSDKILNEKLLEALDASDPIILKKHQMEAALREGQEDEAVKLAYELKPMLDKFIADTQAGGQMVQGVGQTPPAEGVMPSVAPPAPEIPQTTGMPPPTQPPPQMPGQGGF